MDNLEIKPEEVFHAAALGRNQHEELGGTYASTQSQGWDAESGWVGSSGAALSGLLDRWQSHAIDHHQMINSHHERLDTAATSFSELDNNAAERVQQLR
ncbi:WXG100 family type VII secretion target [Mycobacterium cookii]|uniref:WXG100 family type VII secretion target n=1 Tax=Mycobacterium cookii TaxID=1775 RepID=A0A7I7L1N7_9MYCO|nr:WXG100 family type VII secretion target [Mycobacterium cookii]MCV7329805.1 WXG100 family type VII secretion target [Mycobacterium cookii]BBX47947.1 hypothetical protein MCOO_39620 [Mycobacterium cookii]